VRGGAGQRRDGGAMQHLGGAAHTHACRPYACQHAGWEGRAGGLLAGWDVVPTPLASTGPPPFSAPSRLRPRTRQPAVAGFGGGCAAEDRSDRGGRHGRPRCLASATWAAHGDERAMGRVRGRVERESRCGGRVRCEEPGDRFARTAVGQRLTVDGRMGR
jgi:hypothetical protein